MTRVLSMLLVVVLSGGVQAQTEPLAVKVKQSITRGVAHVVGAQRSDGSWDKDGSQYEGGMTALCLLALLNCDSVIEDAALEQKRKKAIEQGLVYLRKIDSPKVYVRALQTMALAEAGTDRALIQSNVQWLLEARQYRGGKFIGWQYYKNTTSMTSDASNSQYAMLALWYARQAGVAIPRDVWVEIREYYTRTQNKDDGSFRYSDDYNDWEKGKASITMSVAGLCGLLIAGMELNGGREEWQKDGTVRGCGAYPENRPVAKALEWIAGSLRIDLQERSYYHLYGLERAGRLSGLRFFGDHDWYREGCEFLTKRQSIDGSWPIHEGWNRWPHTNTAFALLFLSKGRTPVLISKLVHGKWPRNEQDTDWNNDRNDLRHLTDYLSKSRLFGKKAIGWQTYDISQALQARANQNIAASPEDEAAVVADMLQTPILYITGHKSPDLRIQAQENRLIERYVDNGGFIFAEACCGSAKFDKGIRDWVQQIWPGSELEYLESTHPVWTSVNTVRPGEPYKLMGLRVGCRLVMIYSPQDLSCHWESNRLEDGRSQLAFRLGTNIVAYATGRVPPLPRLTQITIASEKPVSDEKRGAFQVGQIRYRADEQWQPAPKAMRNLVLHMHAVDGLEVKLKTERISLTDPGDVIASKFLYMHGRVEIPRPDAKSLESLRFTLENGGLLLADACCGKSAFDNSFRKFAEELFPKEKLMLVPEGDVLFSKEFNDDKEPLSPRNIKCRRKAQGPVEPMAPFLEGIRVNGRWVVLYSKYDLGCALELGTAVARNTSPDCVGYDPASALRIATAVARYNVRP